MNLTIAIQPTSATSLPGGPAIAPAEGENGANTLFSLDFAELALAVPAESGPAAELAIAAAPITVAPAETANSGNPLPSAGGNILPPLRPLPPLPLTLPNQPLAPVAAEQAHDLAPAAPQPAAQLQATPSPVAAPTAASTAASTAVPAAPALTISISVEDQAVAPPSVPVATVTEATDRPQLPSAQATPDKPESPLQKGEAQAIRATTAPQAEARDAQAQHGDGGSGGQERKFAKPVTLAAAADRPVQPAPLPAPSFVTTGSAAIPPVAAPPASEPAAPGFRPSTAETQPQEFEAIIRRLSDAREMARPASADITLLHREFGHVAMQLDMAGRHLKVSLTSADADFAPAVQAALAERGPLAIVEPARTESGTSFSGQNPGSPSPQTGQSRDGHSAPARRDGEPGPQSRPTAETRDAASKAERRGSGLFA